VLVPLANEIKRVNVKLKRWVLPAGRGAWYATLGPTAAVRCSHGFSQRIGLTGLTQLEKVNKVRQVASGVFCGAWRVAFLTRGAKAELPELDRLLPYLRLHDQQQYLVGRMEGIGPAHPGLPARATVLTARLVGASCLQPLPTRSPSLGTAGARSPTLFTGKRCPTGQSTLPMWRRVRPTDLPVLLAAVPPLPPRRVASQPVHLQIYFHCLVSYLNDPTTLYIPNAHDSVDKESRSFSALHVLKHPEVVAGRFGIWLARRYALRISCLPPGPRADARGSGKAPNTDGRLPLHG
jgi:hypothetical protein